MAGLLTIGKLPSGLDAAMNKLYTIIESIEERTYTGLNEIPKMIYTEMETRPPLIPVDVGNLKESYFAVNSKNHVIMGRNPHFRSFRTGAIQRGRSSKIGQFRGATGGILKMERLRQDHAAAIFKCGSKAKSIGKSMGPTIVFGFSAFYALYVHEARVKAQKKPGKFSELVKAVGWTRPGSGPKFFESAIKNNLIKIALMLEATAKGTK